MNLELEMLRAQTEAFIAANPMTISLLPNVRVKQPDGGVLVTGSEARPPQVFRLLPQVDGQQGVHNEVGESNEYPFVLLGTFDSVMDVNDTWSDDDGTSYIISELVHYNGYEKKALVRYLGEYPKSYQV